MAWGHGWMLKPPSSLSHQLLKQSTWSIYPLADRCLLALRSLNTIEVHERVVLETLSMNIHINSRRYASRVPSRIYLSSNVAACMPSRIHLSVDVASPVRPSRRSSPIVDQPLDPAQTRTFAFGRLDGCLSTISRAHIAPVAHFQSHMDVTKAGKRESRPRAPNSSQCIRRDPRLFHTVLCFVVDLLLRSRRLNPWPIVGQSIPQQPDARLRVEMHAYPQHLTECKPATLGLRHSQMMRMKNRSRIKSWMLTSIGDMPCRRLTSTMEV